MIDTEVQIAAEIILSGGSILYPTDTIWGIGCDATNRESVQNIYQIKQRDDRKSMLVLLDGHTMLKEYLSIIPPIALDIIKGSERPTTIIYPGARNLANNLLGADGSIGIRITSDPFCKKLIQKTGLPIVSTSANVSGKQAPGTFHQIPASIQNQVDYVVNWRQADTKPSMPSVIIKLEKDGTFTTLRS